MLSDAELLDRFIDTFGRSDELEISQSAGVDGDLAPILTGPWDADGWARWQPTAVNTPPNALQELYAAVPGPVPPLYESLILSYRWAEVDLGRLRLLASLPPGLGGLVAAVTRDKGLFAELAPRQYFQFGRGPDFDYDPVCFDLNRRLPDGDCPIVKFDHEEILCNWRLVQVAELAPSFRHLVRLVVEDADKGQNRD
jgi:hypothetical protein